MLSRMILAAASIAALTAFMRLDAETTGGRATSVGVAAAATPAARPAGPASTPSPLLSAAANAPATTASGRPVRVILPPLYATADQPASATQQSFVPTPGSPVGPRGAGFARASVPAGKAALASRTARAEATARRAARAGTAAAPRPQALPASVLGGVQPAALVLR